MRRSGLGIRFQLTAAIVIMTLAGIGLIGLLSVKIVERSALFWKTSQASDMAAVVRAALKMEKDSAFAAAFAGAALKEAGITDFTLIGPAGNIVLKSGSLPAGPGERFASADGIESFTYGGGWFNGAGEKLRISAPVEWPSGAGSLDFVLSLDEIGQDMLGAKRFLLFYALIDSAIIIAFGQLFLSRSVVSPLRRLEEAATRIAGGKLFERAKVDIDNEIGSLAASFNTMAARLEDEIRSLERVNVDLMTAQEELLRSSTLAAVGRLAAGIAHEIGNPLGALRGYIDILGSDRLDDGEGKEIVERASREVTRIDSIVREFLDVARPSKKALAPVDVNSLLRDTVATLSVRDDLKEIEIKLIANEAIQEVMADEGKLRQVFANLLINAAHSMEGSPIKSIEVATAVEKRPSPIMARRRKDDPPLAGELPEREFVCVSFSDTGAGVSVEDAPSIFEPFFTTKEAGRGTGLGLFVSDSIIKAFGGEITLKSAPGEGSVFTVALPAGVRH
ncbi:MAG: hypothetical protein A2054_07255 [Deltaproteobacteria bacterium GWA2_55_10]|nr:MAG: hypothetical protein A2054_07255 [Deltaproteobacteria bacterium GWA2_55_10]